MTMLQVVATSVEDCLIAEENGADNIELCSAFELGGLTPSLGLVCAAVAACSIPINVMLRPRPGGCNYSAHEYDAMIADADAFEEVGVSGFVCAILDEDRRIDWNRCRDLRTRFRGRYFTFHRAFDLLADPVQALRELKDLNFNAVLTSGRRATALEGASAIRRYVEEAAEWPAVVPAGGITAATARAFVQASGCAEVHGSFSKFVADPALAALPSYRFGTCEEKLRVVDSVAVAATRAALGDPMDNNQ